MTNCDCVRRSVSNFGGASIRILYSKQSGILCLHLFSLSPFAAVGGPAGGQGT